ncbi:MAG: class I SAM-dependent methyltransferase [Anaerolineae bacterium]|nr:class I SAM-dependent methyltransferase [Anaerolineae bacterium]
MTGSPADLCTLWRLARRRSESLAQYERFQQFMAQGVVRHLEKKGVSMPGLHVLDMGAAWGAYGQVLADAGASITYLDLTVDEQIPAGRWPTFLNADATRTPLRDNCFDFVFCGSLIEHVPDAEAVLSEVYRVIRHGGAGYIGFPPFYSPAGGHQFKPFHLLGEGLALKLKGGGATSYADSHARGGLYRRTIRGVKRAILDTGFQIEDISTRFTALNVARLPWVGEVLTWYVQFLVRKPKLGR